MEPALDVLHRAVLGDSGARSFLNRTSSIYVLDATDPSKPKTYGCWQFIHQAMNEIERYESSFSANNNLSLATGAGLTNHVQLLATMVLHVARRPPSVDKTLVSTCIANAAKYHVPSEQSQLLIDLNLELRDIVMGRLAAMAFDFSFHNKTSIHGRSAFADNMVMETFCATLAANAISNGPQSVNHFVLEWIVPSASTLPPYAVVCVTLYLASEAMRSGAPRGSKDVLQRLSSSILAKVLAPILSNAISEGSGSTNVGGLARGVSNQTAAVALRAINRWCAATDLSLAQVKYLCGKAKVLIVEKISDAMYSDSQVVIDALAELLEDAVEKAETQVVTKERMTQVRYIMEVDEPSFQSMVTPEKLVTTETKEMKYIIDELVSAIGLQRFRFVGRQADGDHDVCRNLTRIAAAVSIASARSTTVHQPSRNASGVIDLLLKAAAHPSVNICAIALEALTLSVPRERGLAKELLPILQRRAITPHQIVGGIPSLAASGICGVHFHEFQNFRENILKDILVACRRVDGLTYMESCTCAIEEFCADNSQSDVSFHLEAALFCLVAVSQDIIMSEELPSYTSQLERCTAALTSKTVRMVSNPLTLAQACCFLRKYKQWYSGRYVEGALDVAIELSLSTFNLSACSFPNEAIAMEIIKETAVSPFSEAALSLRDLLSSAPQHFVSNHAIAALGGAWEASYAASNRTNRITTEDREALCVGICHVLAAIPEKQRPKSFFALALPSVDCLETMLQRLNSLPGGDTEATKEGYLSRIADEIQILTKMARTFTNVTSSQNDISMERGCQTSSETRHAAIKEPTFSIIQRALPSVVQVAAKHGWNEKITAAVGTFATECLPAECHDGEGIARFRDLCNIVASMLQPTASGSGGPSLVTPVFSFIEAAAVAYGEILEHSLRNLNGSKGRDAGSCLESLIHRTVEAVQAFLGETWTSAEEQGQGQTPYESKTQSQPKEKETSKDSLPDLFSLLKVCSQRCPTYILNVPAVVGRSREGDDKLYGRAVTSAVSSLLDDDEEISQSAIDFLLSVVKLSRQNQPLFPAAAELISRFRQDVIMSILTGACGKMPLTSLGCAATLLQEVSRSADVGATLRQLQQPSEKFLRFPEAQSVCLTVLEKASKNLISREEVQSFLEEMWGLHQMENSDIMMTTDVVARFLAKYGSQQPALQGVRTVSV